MLNSNLPLLPTVTTRLVAELAGNPKWRVNQMLVATILGIGARGQVLRIDGSNYTALSKLDAPPGTRVQLQVASMAPAIELVVVNGSKTPLPAATGTSVSAVTGNSAGSHVGTSVTPSIILSDLILQNTPKILQNTPSGAGRVLALIETLSSQPLPAPTAAMLTTLRERIVTSASIASPEALKAALQEASIVLAGVVLSDKGAGKTSGLTLLLQQIVASLTPEATFAGKSPVHVTTRDATGLALYQSVNRTVADTTSKLPLGILPRLAAELEDEILHLFARQQRLPDEINDYAYRWVYELPVNFQDRVRSIAIRIYKEKSARSENDPDASWRAVFSFELENCGFLHVKLFVFHNGVSVIFDCDKAVPADRLVERQARLQELLSTYGLRLTSFKQENLAEDQMLSMRRQDETLSRREGEIALKEFSMQHNGRNLPFVARIPDVLYCAMAALFSYILKIEDSLK